MTDTLGGLWRQSRPWPSNPDATSTATIAHHHAAAKRRLSKGAVAGVAVCTIILGLLLALCLYPFVVAYLRHRIKQRRLGQQPLDTEAVIADNASKNHPPRRTLSTLLHPNNSNNVLAKGHLSDDAAPAGLVLPNFAAPYDMETTRGTVNHMPQNMSDGQSSVLKGTSQDYYRTSVPPSAFGSLEQSTSPESFTHSVSMASSFSHNVRHMLQRKSRRKNTLDLIHGAKNDDEPRLMPWQAAIPAEESSMAAVSTTRGSPDSNPPPSESHTQPLSLASGSRSAEPCCKSLSNISLQRTMLKSMSPPHNPSPGTVNPMDIMAPSTPWEFWHRTEYQLNSSSYTSPPPQQLQTPEQSDSPSPASWNPASSPSVHISSATNNAPQQQQQQQQQQPQQLDQSDTIFSEKISHAADSRQKFCFNPEHSELVVGPVLSDVSSQDTPSTLPDTPIPPPENSLDHLDSISPVVVANHDSSPVRTHGGFYRCDEAGCTQSFDQPHKLKHHQRYHTKEHKCSYKGCDKGFGTKTHLQRHINDRHEKKSKYYCAHENCEYSRLRDKGFPRKDNWKRHMMNVHAVEQRDLPNPVDYMWE